MADQPRIKTPWKQQWKRLRHQLVPVLTFGCSALAVMYLWSRHMGTPSATGEVRLTQVTIGSAASGVLVRLPGRNLDPFDFVEQGQLVARLDDRLLASRLNAVSDELQRLRAELGGFAGSIEALRLDVLEARLRLQRMSRETGGADPSARTSDGDLVRERLERQEAELTLAAARLADAMKRGGGAQSPAPLRQALSAQETALAELEASAAALEIRAPASGVISAVHKVPGQTVIPGDMIATITRPHSRHILAYIRQEQRLRPSTNDTVTVKRRYAGGKGTAARVSRVGQHLEPIPLQQLRDPQRPEWGLPVLIEMPTTFDALPGELVDLRFEGVGSP